MTKLEQIARAIGESTTAPWDNLNAYERRKATEAAQACLTVLAEPDSAMLEAARPWFSPDVGHDPEEAGDCFTTMIKAAGEMK